VLRRLVQQTQFCQKVDNRHTYTGSTLVVYNKIINKNIILDIWYASNNNNDDLRKWYFSVFFFANENFIIKKAYKRREKQN
jgi:hypothetical protein